MRFPVILCCLLIHHGCTKEHQHEIVVHGFVRGSDGEKIIYPAFMIQGEELLTTTDEQGMYSIDNLAPGNHTLICSALGYGDLDISISVKEKDDFELDFLLIPDNSNGTLLGELQDLELYEENLLTNPGMAEWTGKELFDGVSGATIQAKTFGSEVTGSRLFIGDSILGTTDEYGQFWFDVQSGSYPLKVVCTGFKDLTRIVKISQGERLFVNFILNRE